MGGYVCVCVLIYDLRDLLETAIMVWSMPSLTNIQQECVDPLLD